MTTRQSDPLLAAAKVLTVLLQFLIIFAMVAIGIGIGVLVSVGKARVFAEMAKAGAPDAAFPLLIVSFVLIMVMLGMANRFFKELTGIVNSVGEGDPFRIENADRLTRMGWISVGIHGLALLLVGLSSWFAVYLEKAGHHADLGFDVEITGVLLTLILFILARVFRRGAEMREELEGTV